MADRSSRTRAGARNTNDAPEDATVGRTAEEEKEAVHKEASSNTTPGGIYKDAEGDGFHNAQGQPVDQEGNLLEADDSEDKSAGAEGGSGS